MDEMKPGQEIDCPHCGKNTFLVKKSVMNGWQKAGDILACSGCSAKIADLTDTKTSDKSVSVSKLAAFFSEEVTEKKKLKKGEGEGFFCKDCRHFIAHPFTDRCGLHDKPVHPVDDCPEFTPRTPTPEGK